MSDIKNEEEISHNPPPEPTLKKGKNNKKDKPETVEPASDVKEYVIPEKRAARIKELVQEANAFNTSYQSRMHENLVTICEDLDISREDIAEYNADFTKIVVRKGQQSPKNLDPK